MNVLTLYASFIFASKVEEEFNRYLLEILPTINQKQVTNKWQMLPFSYAAFFS